MKTELKEGEGMIFWNGDKGTGYLVVDDIKRPIAVRKRTSQEGKPYFKGQIGLATGGDPQEGEVIVFPNPHKALHPQAPEWTGHIIIHGIKRPTAFWEHIGQSGNLYFKVRLDRKRSQPARPNANAPSVSVSSTPTAAAIAAERIRSRLAIPGGPLDLAGRSAPAPSIAENIRRWDGLRRWLLDRGITERDIADGLSTPGRRVSLAKISHLRKNLAAPEYGKRRRAELLLDEIEKFARRMGYGQAQDRATPLAV